MARVSRLSPLGVSGRLFPIVIAATGTLACGATFSGDTALAGSVGSISATTSFSGSGASIARSTGGSFLARGIFDAGVGESVKASTGSFAGLVQFVGSTGDQLGRLTAMGVSGRFFSPVPKANSVPRLWSVSETFGLSIAITDFTERVFYLVDPFGLSINQTIALSGVGGQFNATTTWTGVSGAIASPAATLAATSTWSGVGQNVIVQSADGSLPITTNFAGQGSTAGTVFGVGVGLLQESTAFNGVGKSTHQAVATINATTSFDGDGTPIGTADGLLASVSDWAGDSTVFSGGAGAIQIAVDFSGIAAPSLAVTSGSMSASVTFSGKAQNSVVIRGRIAKGGIPRHETGAGRAKRKVRA